MSVAFGAPGALGLLLLVPASVWVGRRAGRRRVALVLRAVLLAVWVLALARPRWVRAADALAVAFVLDVSDSVPAAERARAEQLVADALVAGGVERAAAEAASAAPVTGGFGRRSGDDRRASVVVFGQRPAVDRTARGGAFEPVRSVVATGRTDLGAALRVALSTLPADAGRRLVVLSDGRANLGSLERHVGLVQAAGAPIDVVPLAASIGTDEMLVRALAAPSHARIGQRFDLTATVVATRGGRATLRLFDGDAPVLERALDLAPGEQQLSTPITIAEPGFRRFRAELVPEPGRDHWPQNNAASTFTMVAGPPKVLVVQGAPDRAEPLLSALTAAGRTVEAFDAAAAPRTLIELGSYEATVLVDVPARALPPAFAALLPAYVRDLGRGLVMIGGEDAFGAGGYRDTPVEKALPVDMAVRDKQKRPGIAIAFVVDKSGSMGSGDAFDGRVAGMPKIELAKEAVLQAAAVLERQDSVAVVAFDDRAHRVLPVQPVDEARGKFGSVRAIMAGGGTNIVAGLAAGIDAIQRAEAPLKHVILLSDGWSDASGYDALLARLNDQGITLSIVAVGRDASPDLANLASRGGGRHYAVADPADMPQVFVEDTMTALGSYVIEEVFQPVPGVRSEILSGLDAARLPPLGGYNGTSPKDGAQVALWSHLDDPVLAQWQYGLGRSVAWTSDLKRQWATEWFAGDRLSTLVLQMIDWTLPATDSPGLAATVALDGGHATLSLAADDDAGRAVNGLTVQAQFVGPDGTGPAATLAQSAAGRSAAELDLPAEGAYLVRLTALRDGRHVGATTTGAVVPYSPEYADPSGAATDPRLAAMAAATGGRVIGAPDEVFVPVPGALRRTEVWPWLMLMAALLLPVDIAARRLRLDGADVARAAAAVSARAGRLARRRGAPGRAGAGGLDAATPIARTGAAMHQPELGPDPEPEPGPEPEAKPDPQSEPTDRMARLRRAKERARRR